MFAFGDIADMARSISNAEQQARNVSDNPQYLRVAQQTLADCPFAGRGHSPSLDNHTTR